MLSRLLMGSAPNLQKGKCYTLISLDVRMLHLKARLCICVHLCLCLVRYSYLGEEVETAQAADDAVDLGKPSAFTAGLWESEQETDRLQTASKQQRLTWLLTQVQLQD